MERPLPPRQQAILESIQSFWQEHGVAPSLSDIASALGVSRQTVHEHFRALQRKGYLDSLGGTARSWRPTTPLQRGTRRIPIVRRVVAGTSPFTEEDIEGWITVDTPPPSDALFALRVRGHSMSGAGILDGDLVIARQQEDASDGDFVIVQVDSEDAAIKKLQGSGSEARLVAMPAGRPITAVKGERVHICGRVIELRRELY